MASHPPLLSYVPLIAPNITRSAAGDTGLGAETKFGLLGYSGGAIATGWAAALARDYAPEVDVAQVREPEGPWRDMTPQEVAAADALLASLNEPAWTRERAA